MLNAKVKKDATNVINKIIKANIFQFPRNIGLQQSFYHLKLKCQEKF